MTYKQTAKITADVVTLSEVKTFLKITSSQDDDLLQSLINSSVTEAERIMSRDILTTTYQNYRDSFFEDLTLRRGAFQSVVSIEFLSDGSYVVLDTDKFTVTIGGIFGIICEIDTPNFDNECNEVRITFKTGFGDDATFVPENIKTAIKMLVADFYTNRGDCSDGSKSCDPKCSTAARILLGYCIVDVI